MSQVKGKCGKYEAWAGCDDESLDSIRYSEEKIYWIEVMQERAHLAVAGVQKY